MKAIRHSFGKRTGYTRFTQLICAIVFGGLAFHVTNLSLAADEDFPDFNEAMERAAKRSKTGRSPTLSGSEASGNSAPSSFPLRTDRPVSGDVLPPSDTSRRRPSVDSISNTRPADENRSNRFPIDNGDRRGVPSTLRDEPNGFSRSLPAERDPDIRMDQPKLTTDEFDWTEHFTSVADLRLPRIPNTDFRSSHLFDHGHAFLTVAEESAYLDLLDTISEQRRSLVARMAHELKSSAAGKAIWEKGFYQFENARRLAWENGHLRHAEGEDKIGGLPNPFETPTKAGTNVKASYNLLDDINRFPEHFTGRPVVFYGLFRAGRILRIGHDQPETTTFDKLPDGQPQQRPEVPVLRGTLSTFSGDQQIAVIHTKGLLTPQKGLLSVHNSPPSNEAFPVLVKGWVVKKWDSGPLVYCEALRQVSPIPHFELIRQHTVDRRRLRDEETWLYYETLRQLELTSPELQRQTASSVLQQRIDNLMGEVETQTKAELSAARDAMKAGKLTEAQFRQRSSALERRLKHRVARYRSFRTNPEKFQTYVDMFQFPDVYQGYLVTLRGHVRHVVSYPADKTLFRDEKQTGERMLHELWLFTDDSQHNPAVIVTPNLPSDFPVNADVIDRVTVTGCFFKRYVYGSQDTDRIAPLLLAGKIDWTPTPGQVEQLVASGHLSRQSARATKAATMKQGIGRTTAIVIGFLVILTMMILWGRTQREESDRVRLRKRINDLPEFENQTLPGYSLPAIDTPGDYSGHVG